MKQNTGMRNALCDSLNTIFANGKLQIRTGAPPADPNSVASGTLLAEIDLPATPFTAASAGSISKDGDWSAVAIVSGVAGWCRLKSEDDSINMDLTIGTDITIDDVNIDADSVVIVTTCNYSQSAS